MKKNILYATFILFIITFLVFNLWPYNHYLNEPLMFDSFKVSDIKNGKITATKIANDSNGNTYYYSKVFSTNIGAIISLSTGTARNSTNGVNNVSIDISNRYILQADKNNKVNKVVDWPSKYGELKNIVVSSDGTIFASWLIYDKYQRNVEEEGIKSFDASGNFKSDIIKKTYIGASKDKMPHQNGFIKEMQMKDGSLYFYYHTYDGLELYNYNKTLSSVFSTKIIEYDRLLHIIGTTPGNIYFSTDQGDFGLIDDNGNINVLKDFYKENSVINDINFDEDKNIIIKSSGTDGSQIQKYDRDKLTYQVISKSKNSVANTPDNSLTKDLTYSFNIMIKKYIVIGVALIIVLLIIFDIRFIYIYIFQRKVYMITKQLLVLIPIILICFFILIPRIVIGGMNQIMNEVNGGKFYSFNQIVEKKIKDISATKKQDYYLANFIESMQPFSFNKKKFDELNEMVGLSNMRNLDNDVDGMYVVVDKVSNEKIYKLVDSDGDFNVYTPRDLSDPSNYFSKVMSGKSVDAILSNGTYIFTMVPIYNEKNQVVGIYQVGMNYGGYRENFDMSYFKRINISLLITALILISIIVLLMYILIKPLVKLTKSVKEVSAGNYLAEVNIKSKDEVEELSRAFNKMTNNIREHIESVTELSGYYFRFVPEEFFKLMKKKDIKEVNLGDHAKINLCIMNISISNFYRVSEKMSQEESFKFINDYFKLIGPIIRKNNGIVEKYYDRGVIGIFPKKSIEAVNTAIQITQAVSSFNETKYKYMPVADIRISVHRGDVLVGIIGENKRLQGSIVSDSANLTKVLSEKVTDLYSNIVISKEVMDGLENIEFSFRSIGRLSLPDRKDIVEIFDVYEADGIETKNSKDLTKQIFEKGVNDFINGKFYEARFAFGRVLDKNINDIAAREYFYQSDLNYREGVSNDWTSSLKIK